MTSTTPLGNTTTTTYNGFYLPASIEDPLENTTLFTYDEMANLIEVEDAEGNTVGFGYDLLQRVTKITNALNHEIEFEYDTESNLTKLIDPLWREYGYTYDALDRTATWSHPGSGGTETYAYDANSNLTSFTDAGGNQRTYIYDDADRLTSLTWQQGGTNTVFDYSYNDADQLTGATRKYGMTTQSTYSYGYDGAARLTSVTADGRTIGYDYDAAQNVSQLVYPSTLEVNLEYNELGALQAIRDDSSNVVVGYVYDDDTRLTKRLLENGLETVYEYNDAGWVTKIELRETAIPANVLQRFEYGYDKVGNRLWTKYLDGRGDVYQYDATYQVTGVKYDVDDPTDGYALATGAARTVTYAYDAAGNRTSVVDSASTTTTYTVNNLNQYTSVGVVVPVYSDEGYLVEYGDWEYSYDHVGNLVNATDGVINITYTYDANGRRVSRSDGVNTVYYVYSGVNLIEERDALDNVLAEYIYDGALLPRKAIIGGNEYYFQQDVLGNVTVLTDEDGEIVETYEYDIYGKPVIRDENGNPVAAPMTPFLFTGHYWDADTELYLTMYRGYSSKLGKWLTRDPINFSGEDINLYRYVENNPVNYIDIMGLASVNIDGVWWDSRLQGGDPNHPHTYQGKDQGPHMHGSDGSKYFPRTNMIRDKHGNWKEAGKKFPDKLKNAFEKKYHGKTLDRNGNFVRKSNIMLALVLIEISQMDSHRQAILCELFNDLKKNIEDYLSTGDEGYAVSAAALVSVIFENNLAGPLFFKQLTDEYKKNR